MLLLEQRCFCSWMNRNDMPSCFFLAVRPGLFHYWLLYNFLPERNQWAVFLSSPAVAPTVEATWMINKAAILIGSWSVSIWYEAIQSNISYTASVFNSCMYCDVSSKKDEFSLSEVGRRLTWKQLVLRPSPPVFISYQY